MSTNLTRRRFLKVMGAGAAWIALTTAAGCESARIDRAKNARSQTGQPPTAGSGAVRSFRSRPDLSPPVVDVITQARDTAPGNVFVAPKGAGQHGPMIVDNSGQPLWFRPLPPSSGLPFTALDFKAQHYRGEPVLTWWEGTTEHTTKEIVGEYVILDSSYRELKRVRAGNGYHGDHHDFLITPQDTALCTIYNPLRGQDLTSVGGSEDGVVVDGIIQEIDIETGEVLFEWHSLDHVGLDESYEQTTERRGPPFDYFHINSIDIDHDGNLLISARVTFAVYKIDRKTGEIIWRLGGKKSDFEMGPGTQFHYQHDARRQSDGTITIFDNAVPVDRQSRGIVLELDEEAMTARLVREYYHPDKQRSRILANMQVLPNGNVFIGWGNEPVFSEFSSDGELLFDANIPPGVNTYRAFRFPWVGRPSDDPAVAAESGPDDEVRLYASWNGATEVATWQVLAGPDPGQLRPAESAPRDGFETAITVRTAEPYVGVQAKDRSGRVLGTSKALKPAD